MERDVLMGDFYEIESVFFPRFVQHLPDYLTVLLSNLQQLKILYMQYVQSRLECPKYLYKRTVMYI